ncbi:MAG: 3-methyl-2-oxobutanoate hydroxymethyltransferase [Chloroflexi bacterium]|nr:3-methyl-2-oxobutanoate hydroxymethyltransferase [Chloroflexota bacterium]MDA1174551.1 3-methyl-2-oxobutanoate hydroxymethyltransferase [Chloroflexota bacterium]
MPVRITKFREMKRAGEPIPCITAYDYPTAKLADAAGIPLILVGDSLGNVVLGFGSTVHVTMDDMVRHTQAVVRGASEALIVADMPFMSYQASIEDAVRNAGRLVQEAGAHAVKLEGGKSVADAVERITEAGIPVLGHLGLTPQSVNQLGGYRIQGRTLPQAQEMLEDAEALEAAGAFGIVLESVPGPLAQVVTKCLRVPTIGIGAGAGCDGQIQVLHDVLGLSDRLPKHGKQYANLKQIIEEALAAYAGDVRDRNFPTAEHTTEIDDAVLRELMGDVPIDR